MIGWTTFHARVDGLIPRILLLSYCVQKARGGGRDTEMH